MGRSRSRKGRSHVRAEIKNNDSAAIAKQQVLGTSIEPVAVQGKEIEGGIEDVLHNPGPSEVRLNSDGFLNTHHGLSSTRDGVSMTQPSSSIPMENKLSIGNSQLGMRSDDLESKDTLDVPTRRDNGDDSLVLALPVDDQLNNLNMSPSSSTDVANSYEWDKNRGKAKQKNKGKKKGKGGRSLINPINIHEARFLEY